jgi:hypothetical protein
MLLLPAGYVMGHRAALVADLKGHRPKPPNAQASGLSCRYRRLSTLDTSSVFHWPVPEAVGTPFSLRPLAMALNE